MFCNRQSLFKTATEDKNDEQLKQQSLYKTAPEDKNDEQLKQLFISREPQAS